MEGLPKGFDRTINWFSAVKENIGHFIHFLTCSYQLLIFIAYNSFYFIKVDAFIFSLH